jgi:hypothetical protein
MVVGSIAVISCLLTSSFRKVYVCLGVPVIYLCFNCLVGFKQAGVSQFILLAKTAMPDSCTSY